MPLSSDILTYDDLRPLLDEALTSEKGIAVKYPSREKALHARQRMYRFRVLDRLASCGTSIYDSLNIKHENIEGRDCFLHITRTTPVEVIKL